MHSWPLSVVTVSCGSYTIFVHQAMCLNLRLRPTETGVGFGCQAEILVAEMIFVHRSVIQILLFSGASCLFTEHVSKKEKRKKHICPRAVRIHIFFSSSYAWYVSLVLWFMTESSKPTLSYGGKSSSRRIPKGEMLTVLWARVMFLGTRLLKSWFGFRDKIVWSST